jgi:hypothetical protein
MTQPLTTNDPRRLVGWLAVIGALLAWTMAVLFGAAAGFDDEVLAHPVAMIGYDAHAQNLYRLSMWADILGWYLPFLAVGGYLRERMRRHSGALADIALAALVAYAILGIVGAGMLHLTLPPLAGLHTSADPAIKAATESIWLALQNAASGIWAAEAPVLLLWGVAAVRVLRFEKWGYGRLLAFDLGVFAIEFVFTLAGQRDLAEAALMLTLLIHPLWLFLFGISLLREHAPALVGAGMAPPHLSKQT